MSAMEEEVAQEKERNSQQCRRRAELDQLRQEAARKRKETVPEQLPFEFQTFTEEPFSHLPDTFARDFDFDFELENNLLFEDRMSRYFAVL